MAMQIGHVHIKTNDDPQKVAKFYVDNFGATMKKDIPGRGCQLDLARAAAQHHDDHPGAEPRADVGIEHIALQTDNYAGMISKLKGNGAKILEELYNNGRHVCWVECPDGAQMEVIEKV